MDEIRDLFTLEGVNRANAVINFTDDDPFDAKAVWLNAEHIRALSVDELSADLPAIFRTGWLPCVARKTSRCHAVNPRANQASVRCCCGCRFFLPRQASAVRSGQELDSAKKGESTGDAALARRVLQTALEVLPATTFDHDSLDHALREAAASLGLKAGPMFQPIRVAVCGRKNAPPLFETMVVLGRDVCLERIRQAEENLQSLA